MAQGIRPLNASYAAEALPMSMASRGNQAMNQPNPGRPQAADGGDYSKVNMNPQIQINNGLAMQNSMQNGQTAMFQAQAGAQGLMRKELASKYDSEAKAQQGLNATLANVIQTQPVAIPSGGQAIMNFEANKEQITKDVATSVAMNNKLKGVS